MNKIIGISGKKGHGKDTAAHIIKIFLGKNVEETGILSFAQPLKTAVSSLFNINDKAMTDRILKETPITEWDNKTPRQLLQWLGTDVLRKYDQDIFIKNMKQRLDKESGIYKNIVIPDVRFDNEAELIYSLGGTVIQIDATERLGRGDDTHATEYGISHELRDITIYNNSNEYDLEMEIFRLMNEFK